MPKRKPKLECGRRAPRRMRACWLLKGQKLRPGSGLPQKAVRQALPHGRSCFQPSSLHLLLFNYPAGNPRTAAAQGLWMVGMVVAALVNHQCQALDVAEAFQAWCQHRLIGLAVAVDHQRG